MGQKSKTLKNVGWYNLTRNNFFIGLSIILSFFCSNLFAEDLTLADVVAVQEKNASAVETMSADVEATTEFNNQTTVMNYDYKLQRDIYGNNKVMVTNHGTFAMQFLVDTKDLSVTYLMAEGNTKTFKLDPEMQAEVLQLAGVGSFSGTNIGKMYAMSMGLNTTATDAAKSDGLRKKVYETADMKLKVEKEFWGGRAVVTYENKKIKNMSAKIDEKLQLAESKKATKPGAIELKKKFIKQMRDQKENIRKTMIAKRVEKINMKNGIVEEQEFFNEDGDKVGWMKVKNSEKKKFKKARLKNTEVDIEQEFDVPVEMEGEMDSPKGKSKTKSEISRLKINEELNFEWMKPKEFGRKK